MGIITLRSRDFCEESVWWYSEGIWHGTLPIKGIQQCRFLSPSPKKGKGSWPLLRKGGRYPRKMGLALRKWDFWNLCKHLSMAFVGENITRFLWNMEVTVHVQVFRTYWSVLRQGSFLLLELTAEEKKVWVVTKKNNSWKHNPLQSKHT